ncbi:uncharacterized protein BEWA_037750 [Theileria equi strain WA]|uniref:Membrane protein, putative n=1 Tax=Theileria equi strain WA TaxID=1537102 RepID=L1LEZ2_THEEQ|nr:uncharacterized protein BEWA_037750 [Theileria equi strain WA]EKX73738.1 membrane protein, putative [Theileria equi strain WA]|eukprot:XP_004833190.1 uncharacterized protein BEWA_037750 [Theileria equi strain WA]
MKNTLLCGLLVFGVLKCLVLVSKTIPSHIIQESSCIFVLDLSRYVPCILELAILVSTSLSSYQLASAIKELGGLSSTLDIFLESKLHSDEKVHDSIVNILISLSTLISWIFIKAYLYKQNKYHDGVLKHQEENDPKLLKEKCLKI